MKTGGARLRCCTVLCIQYYDLHKQVIILCFGLALVPCAQCVLVHKGTGTSSQARELSFLCQVHTEKCIAPIDYIYHQH